MNFVKSHFKRIKLATLIILGIFFIVLQVKANDYFYLRLADYYKNKHQYTKAIQIYNKIIRKSHLKKNIPNEIIAKINFDLGYSYANLNLTNKAIVSYARPGKNYLGVDLNNYYFRNSLKRDILLAIGLLESGHWEEAVEEFKNLMQVYPNFQEGQKFINTAIALKEKNVSFDEKDSLFLIGDAYIKNELFDEVRGFFTNRILEYGIDPLYVLTYLKEKYANNAEVKQKVWGGEIYVTLEDFEKLETQLNNWLGTKKAKVKLHKITDGVAYKGNFCEYFDISYAGERRPVTGGYDFWIKAVKIPLNNKNLNLGIRFYIKSQESFLYHIAFNVSYAKARTSGTIDRVGDPRGMYNGWKEYRIEDLFMEAQTTAHRNNWSFDETVIDKIIFNTTCYTDRLYIDEIQLFCTN